MYILKIAENIYEVRVKKYPRPLYRGTMTQCVKYMRDNDPSYAYGDNNEQ